MSPVTVFRPKLLWGLVLLGLLLTGIWAGMLYQLLCVPTGMAAAIAPAEGYIWTVVRYQRAYGDFERQLLRYVAHRDMRFAALQRAHTNLVAAFGILARPSELTSHFVGIPAYDNAITTLQQLMADIDQLMAVLPSDIGAADRILAAMPATSPAITEMLNRFRLIELEQRDRAYRGFTDKRRVLLHVSFAMLALTSILIMQIVVVMRARRAVIAHQHAALDAEREAKRRAIEAAAARNTLLGMVSHELRTPLQVIMATAEVLMGKPLAERHNGLIARIDAAAEQLLRLINDLTDYAHLEGGKLELTPAPVDVEQLVADLVEDLRSLAQPKSLRLRSEVSPPQLRVVTDPQRLRQIVCNLVSNAIRYTDGGTIEVTACLMLSDEARGRSRRLHVAVSDTGPGIDEGDRERIFEPFVQLDPTNTRHQGGMGMGLAIVRELARALGGEIGVVSAPGRGSTFYLNLPCETGTSRDALHRDFAPPTPTAITVLPTARVLLVDDNMRAREALAELLAQWGVHSEQGADAEDAYRCLAASRFDALLLDIAMPGTDGTRVAAWLRSSTGPNRRIPIVAVSAYLPEWLSNGEHQLFDAYLPKPVRAGALIATLGRLLQGRAA